MPELQDEVENEDSILNKAATGKKNELPILVRNCTDVLQQLQQLLVRYRSLGTHQKRTWDRIKFGSAGVREIRSKLIFHTSALTMFMINVGTSSLSRIEKKLDDLAAEIRAGQHEPSLVSICADNDAVEQEAAWRLLMSELCDEFTKAEIKVKKTEIKAYMGILVQRGDLDEEATSPDSITPDAAIDPVWENTAMAVIAEHFSSEEASSSTPCRDDFNQDDDMETLYDDPRTDSEAEATTPRRRIVHTLAGLYPPLPLSTPTSGKWAHVGVDIGLDYCRVAAYDLEKDQAVVLPNGHGNR